MIDGLTGDQRFFLGFAQSLARARCARRPCASLIATDGHAPGRYRARDGAQPRRLVRRVRRAAGPEAVSGAGEAGEGSGELEPPCAVTPTRSVAGAARGRRSGVRHGCVTRASCSDRAGRIPRLAVLQQSGGVHRAAHDWRASIGLSAPISSRPISIRRISLVPAPMSSSLASRMIALDRPVLGVAGAAQRLDRLAGDPHRILARQQDRAGGVEAGRLARHRRPARPGRHRPAPN